MVYDFNYPFHIIDMKDDKNNKGDNKNSRRKQFEIDHSEGYL